VHACIHAFHCCDYDCKFTVHFCIFYRELATICRFQLQRNWQPWLLYLCAASTPWFEAYREAFLQMSYPSDHEFIRHYLACILCNLCMDRKGAETSAYSLCVCDFIEGGGWCPGSLLMASLSIFSAVSRKKDGPVIGFPRLLHLHQKGQRHMHHLHYSLF